MQVKYNGRKYEVLNIVDTNTAYGERIQVESIIAGVMMAKFEEIWLCRHGNPSSFSADLEFCMPFFANYLSIHGIEFKDRPARSSHRNGRVECSNGIFKSIFEN